jgi:hypothetical protein
MLDQDVYKREFIFGAQYSFKKFIVLVHNEHITRLSVRLKIGFYKDYGRFIVQGQSLVFFHQIKEEEA